MMLLFPLVYVSNFKTDLAIIAPDVCQLLSMTPFFLWYRSTDVQGRHPIIIIYWGGYSEDGTSRIPANRTRLKQ